MYSKNQQLFLDAVLSGKNVSLSGKAGTGKSYIVKKAIEFLKEQGKKVIAIAPTGVAANNVGGQTIHSMFSLTPYGVLDFAQCNYFKKEKRRMLEVVDTIFIDEISMLRPDILDAINWTLIKNGCGSLKDYQIVFVGDLKQLPSPIDDNFRSMLLKTYMGEEFYNAICYPMLNVVDIELDEVLRQNDSAFIDALNIVRDGGKSEYFRQFVNTEHHGILLAPHNATVYKHNVNGLANLPGDVHTFTAKVSGNAKADDFNVENVINVKHGAKIMYLANSKNNNLVNGTLGTFIVGDDGQYFIDVNGVEYAINWQSFTKKEYVLNEDQTNLELREIGKIEQMPIKLAYALSIHKAQGLTFDAVTIDLSQPCFAKGQLYVALSRVRTPGGLRILVNR